MTARPTVALVYQQTSLPWVFDSARRAGVDLLLVPRPGQDLTADQLPDSVVEVLALDVESAPETALAALRERHARRPLSGVLTLYDPLVPFVADVAAALRLPGLTGDTARVVRDKRLMRQRLRSFGLNTPGFAPVQAPDAWAAAQGLDFPVVVKPATGFSSLGVTRVDSPADLPGVVEEVWRLCERKRGECEGLVVEEYLDGPEFAVEALAYRGEVQILTIGYKGDPQGPHFEEGVYRAPAQLPPGVREEVVQQVTRAHQALGVSDGPTHTELRLRHGHRPCLLELGARVGGSGVSHYIAEQVTGVDLAAEALRIAAGLPPLTFTPGGPPSPQGAAANYIVPCGGSGRLRAVHGLAELREDPRVDLLVQMLFPGDVVRPYPDFTGYPAFVLSHHASVREAERFHETLAREIRVEYAPLQEHEPHQARHVRSAHETRRPLKDTPDHTPRDPAP